MLPSLPLPVICLFCVSGFCFPFLFIWQVLFYFLVGAFLILGLYLVFVIFLLSSDSDTC